MNFIHMLVSLLLCAPSDWAAHAFLPTSTHYSSSSIVLHGSKSELSFEELTKLASDPKAFEAYALGKMKQEKKSDDSPKFTKPHSSYVPIEQWDASRKKEDMSWEERIQFEGQRDGNKFKQNEILRHNLKGF
jgi:hypothetical protein